MLFHPYIAPEVFLSDEFGMTSFPANNKSGYISERMQTASLQLNTKIQSGFTFYNTLFKLSDALHSNEIVKA